MNGIKEAAASIHSTLAEKGIKVGKSHLIDAVSLAMGARSWSAAKAAIEGQRSVPATVVENPRYEQALEMLALATAALQDLSQDWPHDEIGAQNGTGLDQLLLELNDFQSGAQAPASSQRSFEERIREMAGTRNPRLFSSEGVSVYLSIHSDYDVSCRWFHVNLTARDIQAIWAAQAAMVANPGQRSMELNWWVGDYENREDIRASYSCAHVDKDSLYYQISPKHTSDTVDSDLLDTERLIKALTKDGHVDDDAYCWVGDKLLIELSQDEHIADFVAMLVDEGQLKLDNEAAEMARLEALAPRTL